LTEVKKETKILKMVMGASKKMTRIIEAIIYLIAAIAIAVPTIVLSKIYRDS